MADSQQRTRIKLGGLWESETRDGQMVLSGPFGSMGRLVIFRNSYKERDNQPDWICYIEEKSTTTAEAAESTAERKGR